MVRHTHGPCRRRLTPHRVLELFSGIGGHRFAFAYAGISAVFRPVDINTAANTVYAHNFPTGPTARQRKRAAHKNRQRNLEAKAQVGSEENKVVATCSIRRGKRKPLNSSANNTHSIRPLSIDIATAPLSLFYCGTESTPRRYDIWCLSPPCQPYTRKSLFARDSNDNRASALHRCLWALARLPPALLPSCLVLENVYNFETSSSCRQVLQVLKKRNYTYKLFLLSPRALGFPNERLRVFLVAILRNRRGGAFSMALGGGLSTRRMPPKRVARCKLSRRKTRPTNTVNTKTEHFDPEPSSISTASPVLSRDITTPTTRRSRFFQKMNRRISQRYPPPSDLFQANASWAPPTCSSYSGCFIMPALSPSVSHSLACSSPSSSSSASSSSASSSASLSACSSLPSSASSNLPWMPCLSSSSTALVPRNGTGRSNNNILFTDLKLEGLFFQPPIRSFLDASHDSFQMPSLSSSSPSFNSFPPSTVSVPPSTSSSLPPSSSFDFPMSAFSNSSSVFSPPSTGGGAVYPLVDSSSLPPTLHFTTGLAVPDKVLARPSSICFDVVTAGLDIACCQAATGKLKSTFWSTGNLETTGAFEEAAFDAEDETHLEKEKEKGGEKLHKGEKNGKNKKGEKEDKEDKGVNEDHSSISMCFTKSYGRYIDGTGSVWMPCVYGGMPPNDVARIVVGEGKYKHSEMVGDNAAINGHSLSACFSSKSGPSLLSLGYQGRLRYFHPDEIARLMGFKMIQNGIDCVGGARERSQRKRGTQGMRFEDKLSWAEQAKNGIERRADFSNARLDGKTNQCLESKIAHSVCTNSLWDLSHSNHVCLPRPGLHYCNPHSSRFCYNDIVAARTNRNAEETKSAYTSSNGQEQRGLPTTQTRSRPAFGDSNEAMHTCAAASSSARQSESGAAASHSSCRRSWRCLCVPFSFPGDLSLRSRWAMLGNSLNPQALGWLLRHCGVHTVKRQRRRTRRVAFECKPRPRVYDRNTDTEIFPL
eukprot:GHVT01077308.1.p1 GENE.GHVT01077308.1~~GHVT01077308.1.p1  ORF type:complete len:990 (-),score=138.24 GHVT01077308.1:313-3282(-)